LPDGPYRYPDPAGELCGNTKHALAVTPAEVMLVLDRSLSMQRTTIPPSTMWDDASAAIKGVMAANPNIAWGIKLFPTGEGIGVICELSPEVEVPALFGTTAAIAGVIDQSTPPTGFGTPTHEAMKVVTRYLKTVSTPLPKYTILVTDGEPSCDENDDDPDSTIRAIEDAAKAGFRTFVIGFENEDPGVPETLDRMAVAGGKPRAGTPRYYRAANRADLDAALAAITRSLTNCVFPLAVPPLDPGFVGVSVDGQLIPRDPTHAQGWDYVMNGKGVEIFGSACTDLKNGTALSVGVHYGCPK
jgi:hypothetical protein